MIIKMIGVFFVCCALLSSAGAFFLGEDVVHQKKDEFTMIQALLSGMFIVIALMSWFVFFVLVIGE